MVFHKDFPSATWSHFPAFSLWNRGEGGREEDCFSLLFCTLLLFWIWFILRRSTVVGEIVFILFFYTQLVKTFQSKKRTWIRIKLVLNLKKIFSLSNNSKKKKKANDIWNTKHKKRSFKQQPHFTAFLIDYCRCSTTKIL